MKILVANLGSTSFKYRLFDMDSQRQLARGGIERIGSPESRSTVQIGDYQQDLTVKAADHVEAVHHCLAQLTDPAARLPPRRVGGLGDRLEDCPRRPLQRSAAGDARRACGDGGDVRRGPGAQSALHRRHAPAGREAAANSARGRVRNGFPCHDPAAQPALCHSLRVVRIALRPPLGIPRGQPSLHRRADGRVARPQRPADHLLPPGRFQFAVRHSQRPERGHDDGHEPAERPAAEQPRGRFRRLRPAADHASRPASRWRKCFRSWPTRAVCWASAA